MRDRLIAATMRRRIRDMIRRGWRPDVIVTYNLAAWVRHLMPSVVHETGIPWVYALADIDGPERPWVTRGSWLEHASGHVFLSYAGWKEGAFEPKLHLDGGTSGIRDSGRGWPQAQKKVVAFAGSLNAYSGFDLFIQSAGFIPREEADLWVMGPGDVAGARRLAEGRPNVTVIGFLSRTELERRLELVDVFVNPRPNLPDSRYNFPSKVLDYLSALRPVVSTWSEGLSPDYRAVLEVSESATPQAIAAAIRRVLSWDGHDFERWRNAAAGWLARERLWDVQARRFLHWMNAVKS
jgi:glycosyltransferase involved in cell wall biosynthesis